MALLDVRDLNVRYSTSGSTTQAVDDVSFSVKRESIVGLVGESGCGKTTLAKSLVGDLPANADISGHIMINGMDIAKATSEEIREIRWDQIAFVPQNAMDALDPVYTIREQLVEAVVENEDSSKKTAEEKAKRVLDIVDIDKSRLNDYPHQLSGGMKQRIVLAMALILDPELIITDEPTTGLDVLVRDKILGDIERYRDEFGISFVIITHDLADIVETSDYMIVMYGGKIMERGPSRDLFNNPTNPYTICLKQALPDVHDNTKNLMEMPLDPPNLSNPPSGCRFIEKCPFKIPACRSRHPPLEEVREGVDSACFRSNEKLSLEEEGFAKN